MRTRIIRLFIPTLAILAILIFLSAVPAAADSPFVHVVGWGDTLSSIAARYGTTVNALQQANNLHNADFIWTGQRLVVSGGSNARPSTTSTYVVQAGDTLFSIATRYETTVADLMAANKLYNYWIYVGQALRIPGQPATRVVPPPPAQGPYYVVRPGDYLSTIAARYGTTPYAIQIANRMPNASFIWVGQRLFIPGAVTIINQPAIIVVPPAAPLVQPPIVPPTVPTVQVPPSGTMPGYVTPTAVPPVSSVGSGTVWEAVLLANTSAPPCYLSVNVVGKSNWPVVVATTDGSYISEPKLTGTKPDKGPYIVEFAHSCTGTWRVIPLGLDTFADVTLQGGHADLEFHLR